MYRICIDGKIIGETKFEFGDSPMGMVFGEFIPSKNYIHYKDQLKECWVKQNFEELNITVFDEKINKELKYNWLAVEDFDDGDIKEININLNMGYPDYKIFFKNHIDEYDKRFGLDLKTEEIVVSSYNNKSSFQSEKKKHFQQLLKKIIRFFTMGKF
jgi:hypothetical protein